MAETIPVIQTDKRLEQVFEQILRLANADFRTPGVISDAGDELDSIIVGLNLLGEELESYTLQLKESREKLENTLIQLTDAQHLSHIGSWEWDIAANIVSWTDELYRIYGRNREDFESNFENFLACVHPEDREYVNNIIQTAYREKKPFSFSHCIVRPDGMVCVLDCKGNVYVADDGALKRMTGTAQDVTQLKKAEERALRLAAIVESTNDGIISKTTEGYITSWNKHAEIMFGYTEKEALGKHISLIFPPDRLAEEDEILARIKSGGSWNDYETVRQRKDGSLISVAATISSIKDPSGKIIGVSKIVRDITEKKLAEEKLKAYTEALEQRNRETEQFAFIASHDLQEPLRTISNYIGLLQGDYKGKLDPSADMYLDFIGNASSRMKTLINNLLDYTRIQNDSNAIQVDCDALVNEVIQDMEATIAENNATIKKGPLPLITGYYSGYKSLFQNLFSNAIKFRKPGVDPVISITATDKGADWLFEVKDNGIGIEEIYFEKIFKIFQRLHARTEYQGTGIGLAHCKKIIDLRGGKIWVSSQPGNGSSFYFTLPKKYIL